jgi:membrane fusion protein, macrolide-specific efflux system
VSLLNYKKGDVIYTSDNKPMATVINNNTLFIEADIEESDISKLKTGQKAAVTFDAIEGKTFDGELSYVSLTSETSSNGIVTYLVRVLLPDAGASGVREGMTASVNFILSGVSDVLAVPVDAVRNVNGKPSVQLADGSYQAVTTGFTDGKSAEVISGLSEGDKIVY